jgi:hypothetical protein
LAAISAVSGFALLWTGAAYGFRYLYVPEPVPFFIERPVVRALASVEYADDSNTGPNTDTEKDTTTTRQKLDIRSRGWAYHPALVIFDMGLRPEFRQTRENKKSGEGSSDDQDADFLGYHLDTTWLQQKPYTVNLYTSRDKSETTSTLAATTETTTKVDRGRLMLKYPVLPTTMTLERREADTEAFFRTVDENTSFRIESEKETQNSRTTLDMEAREQERQIVGSRNSTDRFQAFLRNTYNFGNKSSLISGLEYSDSDGDTRDTRIARISSRLRLQHRQNFSTHYYGRYDDRKENDFTTKSTTLAAGLTHLLYENLTTSFNATGTRNEQSTGDLDTGTAHLNFRYRRSIPGGRLRMDLGLRERIEDDQREADYTPVFDESHVFVGASTQIFLDNANVDNSSIIVTDSTGIITYVEGIDYVVDTVGDSTRITRDPFGGIGDNQLVLVSYRYDSDPPHKIGLTTVNFGTSAHLFDMLTLSYQRGDSKERLISGELNREKTDDTIQRAYAELEYKWSTTHAEVEDRDSTTTPLKRFLVRQTLKFRPGRRIQMSVGADYGETELQDTGETTKSTGANATLTWRIGPGMLRARAFGRRNRSSTQRWESKGLISTYEWRYGAWYPVIRYEYLDDVNEISDDKRKRHILYFEIKRTFY